MHLDISETMSGVALAYDWLYAELDLANRTLIANTLVYVLSTAYRGNLTATYGGGASNSGMFWVNASSNWNCVSSAGPITAVLALMDEAEAPGWLWSDILAPAVVSTATCFGSYGPDSHWDEGMF